MSEEGSDISVKFYQFLLQNLLQELTWHCYPEVG
jgi:hypothetical protein